MLNNKTTVLEEKVLRKRKLSKEIVINLQNIGKKYYVHHEKPTLADDLSKRLRFQKKEEYWALRNINLTIHKGEKIGFYGQNGAGKTTLFKIIAKITTPTEGRVSTNGRIISLIDLEAGFHPDLTGIENIFLNGLLIGMSKEEIEENLQQIIDFSEIGSFITAPLYTYSSGMKIRLGFSVAINASPDVLLLDEVMNMVDRGFQRKSIIAMKKMLKSDVTVLMISQWIGYLRDNCDKIIFFRAKK